MIPISINEEAVEKAIDVISTTIANCEKAQMKFSEGTSQYRRAKYVLQ